MSNRNYAHITLVPTPFKVRLDTKDGKGEVEIERDTNVAYKCADRFNYNANLHRKVALSDRFELTAMGFEMKAKPKSKVDLVEEADNMNFIYRKEKKQDLVGSPLPAGMSKQNPVPAGRGFLSPPNSGRSFNPPQTIFDDIPANIV